MSYPAGGKAAGRPRVTAAIDMSQALSPPQSGRTLVIVLVAASADRSPRPFPDELHVVLPASSFTLIWAISRRHS